MKKQTNDRWHRRRALWAATAACGVVVPGVANAAPLHSNLAVNGDFENVDVATVGDYNAPRILNWVGSAFAYSHDGSASSGGVVPDYADGADPPGAAHWYFTSNNGPLDIDAPGEFYQDIDVSQGPTASLIASGAAGYNLSAFMSSYLNDGDNGSAFVEFFDPGGASLGTGQIDDNDPGPDNVWSRVSLAGSVPVGTSRVRLSVFGEAVNGGPDGYIDNVEFSVVPEPSALGVVGGLAAFKLTRRRRRYRGGPP